MRKAFNFYRSYWEIANELNDKERLEFYDALLTKQFTGKEIELNGLAKFAFLSQKHSIDNQIFGYVSQMNKKHPNKDPWQGGTEAPTKAPTVQEKEKVKEKVKVKEKLLNIDERKQIFYLSLSKYLNEYSENMINDFFNYWSEHGDNDKKMRFEKQTTFGISQRLKTWQRNEKTNFNNHKKINHEQHDKIIEAIRITGKRF